MGQSWRDGGGMNEQIGRIELDRMRAEAGITVVHGKSNPSSLMHVERWAVRQDSTFRFFRSETDANTYADELAMDLAAVGAIGSAV